MKRSILLFFISCLFIVGHAQQTITPETALKEYLNNNDPTWGWEVRKTHQLENAKWSWDANRRKWLYDSDITDKLPQYKIANSKIVSRNISK